MKVLKLPLVSYPDTKVRWTPPVQEVILVDGEVLITEKRR